MDKPQESSAWLERADGEKVVVRGTCTIGRSPTNEIVLVHEKVSRRHAFVHAQELNQYWLVDLGSSNGTYVNGRRVVQPIHLHDGDRIDVGECRLVFWQPSIGVAPKLTESDADQTLQEIKSSRCWLLVADIESSTQMIRSVSPEELPKMMGGWLAECKQLIEECGGVINKFLGDGFLAYWHDREAAGPWVARALNALKRVQAEGSPPFRVVLHYGQVFTGGGASLGEESLLGKEVNFVFRMEKLAAGMAERRLLSETAQGQLGQNLVFGESLRARLPGFEGEFLFYTF